MMKYVNTSIKDADIILLITDIKENEINHKQTLSKIQSSNVPIICLINKIDLSNQDIVSERLKYWGNRLPKATIIPISALHKFNLDRVWNEIISQIPESPPYFDKNSIKYYYNYYSFLFQR